MIIKIDNIHNPAYAELKSNLLQGKWRFRKRGVAYIYCGRPGPLGNPFVISRGKSREVVIEEFRKKLGNDMQNNDNDLTRAIKSITEMVISERFPDGEILKEIMLLCYCYPKPCHADVILRFLIQDVTSKTKHLNNNLEAL